MLTTVTGVGILAQFKLAPNAIPNNPTGEVTLSFDNIAANSRETQYHQWPPGESPGIYDGLKFATYNSLTLIVAGAQISPALPDTVLIPGDDLTIWLGGHLFSQFYDSTLVTWMAVPGSIVNPSNIPFAVTDQLPADSTYTLTINTVIGHHDSITATIRLDTPDPLFWDEQTFRVYVDHVPVFDTVLPLYSFDEDTRYGEIGNGLGGGGVFTDLDDNGTGITAWMEPSAPIQVTYDAATDSLFFFADTNWFGTDTSRLFIRDALGQSIDTLLNFIVTGVNDAPIFNLDSLSGKGDTLVIHHNQPPTVVDLSLLVTDEENNALSGWTLVNNADPVNLPTASLDPTTGVLTVDALDTSPLPWDVELIIEVSDNGTPLPATTRDTLVVSIRPFPPVITVVKNIKIDSRAVPPSTGLNLANWVNDLDTPANRMTWTFRALDAVTFAGDARVTYSPFSGSVTDTVTIGVTQIFSAIDILELTVTDDAGQSDVDTARMFIFDGPAPLVFPFADVTLLRDTTVLILDLDDYVADITYSPADINWSFTGGDSLLSVDIGFTDHVVTVTTDRDYFGPDTLTFTATNPDSLTRSGAMAVWVIPRFDGPPFWYPLPDLVEVVSGYTTPLFILKQKVKDDFTPFSSLVITPVVNPDPLKPLTVPPIDPAVDSTFLEVPGIANYLTWLYFTATDTGGRVSQSDTIYVDVRDSFSPVWQRISPARMKTNSTYRDTLNKYISDRDTPLANLTLSFDPASVDSRITVSYDPATTELIIRSSGAPSSSFLKLIASDPLPEGNTTNFSLEVTVALAFDVTPPDGEITYFFHPVSADRISYVVVADSTAIQFNPTFIKRISVSTVRDEPLTFVQRDSLPGLQTWVAAKKFPAGGEFELTVDLLDFSNNILSLFLNLTIALSKSSGDTFTSPDQRLTVSYPPMAIENGKLIVLAELPEPDGLSLPGRKPGTSRKERPSTGGNSRGAQDMELGSGTIYAIDTNLPKPILVTITYHQNQVSDAYYSFYEVEGIELQKIETYTSGAGQFQADVLMGKDIIFGPSDSKAQDGPLPEGYLLSYPNPFNATLQVRFMLRRDDSGKIVIYDILGREIFSTLKRPFSAGVNEFSWHGISNHGQQVPTGLYFIRVQTDGGTVMVRKVTLLK